MVITRCFLVLASVVSMSASAYTTEHMSAKCMDVAKVAMTAQASLLRCVLDQSSIKLDPSMSRQVAADRALLWFQGQATCALNGTNAELHIKVNYNVTQDSCKLP